MPRNRNTAATPVRSTTLTARSVLLSVLLGTDSARLPVGLLVSTTELFGIAEGTTRTALSRMVTAGEVTADDGWYAIASPRLLQRQERQSFSRRGTTVSWDGSWIEAVVVSTTRRPASERSALRQELTNARMAELREGVWLRPDNLGGRPLIEASELRWLVAKPDNPTEVAAHLWDLDGWSAAAAALLSRIADLTPPLERGERSFLAAGFVLSADVLRHLQADPLLPGVLQPPRWRGAELRGEYERYDEAYRSVLRAWFDEHR